MPKVVLPGKLKQKLAQYQKDVSVKGYSRGGRWVSQHTRKADKKLTTDGVLISAGVGGAGSALLGLRGRGVVHKMKDAPVFKENPSQLFSKAKPGDVVLVGRAEGFTASKIIIGAGTGTSEVYHAAIVEKTKKGALHMLDHTDGGYHRSKLDASGRMRYKGGIVEAMPKKFRPGEGMLYNVSIFRPKDPEVAKRGLALYNRRLDLFAELQSELQKRGLPEDVARRYIRHSYSFPNLFQSSYRELLAPIILLPPKTDTAAVQKKAADAMNQMETNMSGIADAIMDRHNKNLPIKDVVPENVRHICTTAISASGIPIHGNKLPTDGSPGDVWRSVGLEQVGHFRPKTGKVTSMVNLMLKPAPHVLRAGVGAGIGVGGYALAKKVLGKRKAAEPKA